MPACNMLAQGIEGFGMWLHRSSEYAAVKESFDAQYKRQQAVIQPLQPAALIAALERAASNADKDSDQVGTHVYSENIEA